MSLFNISLIYVHCAKKKAEEAYYSGENVASLQFFQS